MSQNAALQQDPGTLTAQDVYACLAHLCRMAGVLPDHRLLPGERMARGGRVFLEAQEFVMSTAEALLRGAELFGHIPVDPHALIARQNRALALISLQRGLLILAQRAGDLALIDRSDTVEEAMTVVRAVREEAAAQLQPPVETDLRVLYMRAAERALADRQRNRQAEPSAAVSSAEKPASPQRRAAERAAAHQARVRVDAVIATFMGARRARSPPPAGSPPPAMAAPPAAGDLGPGRRGVFDEVSVQVWGERSSLRGGPAST